MKTFLVIIALAPLVMAQPPAPTPETNVQPFAVEWRVTGFVKQGQCEEACLERSGLMPRFVREGDRLPGDVVVVGVNYQDRSVTINNGRDSAVIHPEQVMLAPATPKKTATVSPSTTAAAIPLKPDKASGQWTITFDNGRSYDMQAYTQRHGGVKASMQHVREQLQNETDPQRIAYRKQQLQMLQQMRESGVK